MQLRIKVIPKSPRTEWAETLADGTRKLRLAAVPEKGKANEELIRFLSAEYRVPRSAIEIVSGHTAPLKLVRVRQP